MKLFTFAAILVTLFLLLAGARVANAESRVVATGGVAAGPLFAGDDIVYAGYGRSGSATLQLHRIEPDGTSRVLHDFRVTPIVDDPVPDYFGPLYLSGVSLGASEAVTVASYWSYTSRKAVRDPGRSDLVVGRADVAPVAVACKDDETGELNVAADGTRYAVASPGCPVVVRDTATGAERTAGTAGTGEVRLIGDHVAYDVGSEIEVFDLRAGAVAYRVPIPPIPSWQLAPGGRVVLVAATVDGCSKVVAYGPQDTDGRTVTECGGILVAVDGERIVMRAPDGLALSDFAGMQRTIPLPVADPGGIDVDRGRVAVSSRGCSARTGAIHTFTLDDPPAQTPARIPCTAIAAPSVRIKRGVARVTITCPTGCSGSLRLDLRGTRRYVRLGEPGLFDLAASQSRTFKIPVGRKVPWSRRGTAKGRAVLKIRSNVPGESTRTITRSVTLRR